VRNELVLDRIGEGRNLWENLTRRRDGMAGHIPRHPGLVNLVMKGENYKGRQRMGFLRMWAVKNMWK
jgi:hypothetical protein